MTPRALVTITRALPVPPYQDPSPSQAHLRTDEVFVWHCPLCPARETFMGSTPQESFDRLGAHLTECPNR